MLRLGIVTSLEEEREGGEQGLMGKKVSVGAKMAALNFWERRRQETEMALSHTHAHVLRLNCFKDIVLAHDNQK